MFHKKLLNNEIVEKVATPMSPNFIEILSTQPNKSPLGPDWQSKPCVLIEKYYDEYAERIKTFEVREDDVWVVTYPKCGTTWTQEITWLINNNLDFETAIKIDLNTRSHFLEMGGIQTVLPMDTVNPVIELPSPRTIKSHLPMNLLPDQLWTKKPKIIYVTRNPKDVAISWYHHYSMLMGYNGSLEDFLEAFLNDSLLYSPFFGHFIEFWHMRNEENILFITYEDLKKDTKGVLKIIAKFLNKSYTEEQFEQLTEHVSFESMKKNPATNNKELTQMAMELSEIRKDAEFNFMRKGKVGSFKDELSEEFIKRIDAWTTDSLKDIDFKFNL